MKKKTWYELRSWILSALFALAIIFLLNNFVLKTAKVSGISMANTLHDGDFGVTWVYPAKMGNIKRFDIVVIDEKDEGLWIKRVIGLPNDTVEYKEGKLLINDQEMGESFLSEPFLGTVPKITLKENEYYVMGDNRNHSKDSRIIGPVSRQNILSTGFVVMYPFNHFGVIK